MNDYLEFSDLNFKLAVINQLMYIDLKLGKPFDIFEFAENYKGRKIDVDSEGYDIIPEALEYFKNLKIPAKMAASITEIEMDGGDDIYLNIIPYWDGESDEFNIKSAVDTEKFPNLKKVVLFYDSDEAILSEFEQKGIAASFL